MNGESFQLLIASPFLLSHYKGIGRLRVLGLGFRMRNTSTRPTKGLPSRHTAFWNFRSFCEFKAHTYSGRNTNWESVGSTNSIWFRLYLTHLPRFPRRDPGATPRPETMTTIWFTCEGAAFRLHSVIPEWCPILFRNHFASGCLYVYG